MDRATSMSFDATSGRGWALEGGKGGGGSQCRGFDAHSGFVGLNRMTLTVNDFTAPHDANHGNHPCHRERVRVAFFLWTPSRQLHQKTTTQHSPTSVCSPFPDPLHTVLSQAASAPPPLHRPAIQGCDSRSRSTRAQSNGSRTSKAARGHLLPPRYRPVQADYAMLHTQILPQCISHIWLHKPHTGQEAEPRRLQVAASPGSEWVRFLLHGHAHADFAQNSKTCPFPAKS